MQSMLGKIRLLSRQTLGIIKNADLNSVAAIESKFFSCSVIQSSQFNAQHCSDSAFILKIITFQNKNFGSLTVSTTSKIDGMASVEPSYRGLSSYLNQSTSTMFSLPTRSMTTMESTSQDSSAFSNMPQRIKFKRLDKTARNIMQIINKEAVEEVKANREIPDIRPGYIIQLKLEVPENKRRVSVIKGIVIARRNAGLNTTFRIRRLVAGVGIESLLPLYSPNIKEIKVLDKKKVRRAKLYYLRDKMNALKKQ
ncbi:hypothetical protein DH2020_016558 [Rehmannia glutinosa]|uniref:Uncharacterized protein n=1 Tax=Rehmannia glutinosa TaxID=99300 RepID=A0ABR0WNB2_REHGL